MNWWLLRRKLHSSWLLCSLAVGILAGVILSHHVGQDVFSRWIWLAVGLELAGIALWRRSIYILPLVIVSGMMIGGWRSSVDRASLTVYSQLYNHTSRLEGVVADDPDTGKNTEVIVTLSDLTIGERPLPGTLWLSLTTGGQNVKRGDHLGIQGKLKPGFGPFAASMYRAALIEIQRPVPGDAASIVRDDFAANVKRAVAEPQASLGIGFVVGQRRALPGDLADALRIAGLTHIIVASGYNLTILVRLARRVFVRISKYLAAVSATAMIVGFIAITGASPSMTRAGLVAGMSLAAWYYGRKFHPIVLLSVAAAITVLIRPSYLMSDLGWQLSFAAFAGVMLLAPLMQRYFFGEVPPNTIRQILGETVAAQIATLPILIFAFGQFSNVALFANLLILPFVPLAMLLTVIAGTAGIFLPMVGVPAEWLLGYMVAVAEYLAGLSWAQTAVQMNGYAVLLLYAGIIGGGVYLWWRTHLNLRETNLIE